jgi:hypothetical protein
MNIFYLDENPQLAARYHNNRHSVKMILEYSQMLSTAHRMLDGIPIRNSGGKQHWELSSSAESILYKVSHRNHPSAIWTRTNRSNYLWLFQLLEALHEEYTYRYERIHKSSKLLPYLSQFPQNLPEGEFFEPPLAMDEQYKLDDALSSYRNYYVYGKSHLAEWKKRKCPEWYV